MQSHANYFFVILIKSRKKKYGAKNRKNKMMKKTPTTPHTAHTGVITEPWLNISFLINHTMNMIKVTTQLTKNATLNFPLVAVIIPLQWLFLALLCLP